MARALGGQIIDGGDIAAFGHDNHLHALRIAGGEIHALLAFLGHGHARHYEVHLAAGQRRNQGIKRHIHDFQFIAQLFADQRGNFGVDADDGAAFIIIVLVGLERGVRAHLQRFRHGGEGENQNAYDCDGNQLFHLNTLHIYALFALKRFASVDGMIIHRRA